MAILKVTRTYIPLHMASNQWEQSEFDRVVWEIDDLRGMPAIVRPDKCPQDFYRGLLRCYIDGKQVDLGTFDDRLSHPPTSSHGWTRASIEAAIAASVSKS